MSESLREYELVVIALPQSDDEALAAFRDLVAGWITAHEGVVTETNVWGRRSLAYEINKQTEGIYIQYKFQAVPSAIREVERSLRLDEQTIRHLVIRLDED